MEVVSAAEDEDENGITYVAVAVKEYADDECGWSLTVCVTG